MSDVAIPVGATPKPKLDHPVSPVTVIVFLSVLAAGLAFTAYSLYSDMQDAGVQAVSSLPFKKLRRGHVIDKAKRGPVAAGDAIECGR